MTNINEGFGIWRRLTEWCLGRRVEAVARRMKSEQSCMDLFGESGVLVTLEDLILDLIVTTVLHIR